MDYATLKVTRETMEKMEAWRARVEVKMDLPRLSWDQFFSMWANTEKLP
jgi:hypothetical protein